MKTIELIAIDIENDVDKVIIHNKLLIDNNNYDLICKINRFEADIRINERFDCIVCMFLYFAIKFGYNFKSIYPISTKLFYSITNQIVPQLCKYNKIHHVPVIECPIYDIPSHKLGYVATGVSCGVDSLATIKEYSEIDIQRYKLTHLVYFKAGAHDGQIGCVDEKLEDSLYLQQLNKIESFSNTLGYPLITIDTNLNSILEKAFGFSSYDRSHIYRNVGLMLLLQDYISIYLYADTYSLDNFSLDLNDDCAHYEKWLLNLLSSNNLEIYSANKAMSRIEKTRSLITWKYSYDNLIVCWTWNDGKNCGKCDKCIRTMITLEMLNSIEKYKNCFDLNNFYKDKELNYCRMIVKKNTDVFFNDIYNYIKDNNVKMNIHISSWIKYFIGRYKMKKSGSRKDFL